MPVVRYTRGTPASIAEGSGPSDWVANLALSGDLLHLVAVETAGPMAAFFSAAWNPSLGLVTIRPNAELDFEAFSAAGALPQAEIALAFVFDDGSRQAGEQPLRVAVLDRDDTAPSALSFSAGGTVAAGAIGAAIGRLSVADPDSSGPFFFSFTPDDDWRFEVVDGVLKLRDGISLGWDDLPLRPVVVEVSDGAQSAAFVLDVSVTAPDHGPVPYAPPALVAGETRGGFALAGPREALTARRAEEVAAVTPHPGGLRQVLLDTGESIWLGPSADRLRFADGWLDLAPDGAAAQAAALHRAIIGEAADGVQLAPLVASLRSGAGWADVAGDLIDSVPALAVLGDMAFVRALAGAALGAAPDAGLLASHAARLAGGASRAQVAVDIALSPEALADLAADTPAGHWVAGAFDNASHLPARAAFEDPAPAITAPAAASGWFM